MQYYNISAPYYNINMIQGLDKVQPINSKYILTIHLGCAQNPKKHVKIVSKILVWFRYCSVFVSYNWKLWFRFKK